jgi:hypothetical protein
MKTLFIALTLLSINCFAHESANLTGNSGLTSEDSSYQSDNSSDRSGDGSSEVSESRSTKNNVLRNKQIRNEVINYFATKKITPVLKKEITKVIETFSPQVRKQTNKKKLEKKALRIIAKKNKI